MKSTTKDTQLEKLLKQPIMQKRVSPSERLRIWEQARGMWAGRKPDPIKELEKMRAEWDRELPTLKRKKK